MWPVTRPRLQSSPTAGSTTPLRAPAWTIRAPTCAAPSPSARPRATPAPGSPPASIQHSPAGAGTWTTTPAAFDTTGVTDGLYDLRVTVTDNAGNSTISATVVNRRVDNTAPSRLAGRSGRQPARHRHAHLNRLRPGWLRRRHPHLSALSRRRRHLDDDPGRLRHDRRYGRALRPARDRHRQRR